MQKNETVQNLTRDKAAEMFLQHFDFVRLIAFHSSPARHLQEDIIHDVFIEFVDNAEKWKIGPDGPRPLLRTIVRNISLQHWRTWVRSQPEFLQKLAGQVWPDQNENTIPENSDLQNQIDALNLCMNHLSPENKRLIELFYYHDLTADEISRTLNKKSSTIYSLLSRLRMSLQNCIERKLRKGGSHEQ
ncbi:MAG: sigma-70 family RNA polymerase sigma factor [Planctomycetia bacterium]|nr:sigma-70 family RNA polymerase sigma factor [Planctomycetia bacterium]